MHAAKNSIQDTKGRTCFCLEQGVHHEEEAEGGAAAAAKSLQSCPTLGDPIDGSPPGSAVPGILQARTLEWLAISFSNAWKWKVKVKSLSHVQPSATPWTSALQAPPSWDPPGKSFGVGCHWRCRGGYSKYTQSQILPCSQWIRLCKNFEKFIISLERVVWGRQLEAKLRMQSRVEPYWGL